MKANFASLLGANAGSRQVVFSESERRQLEELRYDLDHEIKPRRATAATIASRQRTYSKDRT
jgi:hypothetical protein